MSMSRRDKSRLVVQNVDNLSIAALKTLAIAANQSMGYTLDQAIEYFSRKVQFEKDKPLKWRLPDDY